LHLKVFLNDRFQIKDLRLFNFFLGLEFCNVDNGMVIHQQKYIRELLELYSMTDFNNVATPISYKESLSSTEVEYRSVRRVCSKLP